MKNNMIKRKTISFLQKLSLAFLGAIFLFSLDSPVFCMNAGLKVVPQASGLVLYNPSDSYCAAISTNSYWEHPQDILSKACSTSRLDHCFQKGLKFVSSGNTQLQERLPIFIYRLNIDCPEYSESICSTIDVMEKLNSLDFFINTSFSKACVQAWDDGVKATAHCLLTEVKRAKSLLEELLDKNKTFDAIASFKFTHLEHLMQYKQELEDIVSWLYSPQRLALLEKDAQTLETAVLKAFSNNAFKYFKVFKRSFNLQALESLKKVSKALGYDDKEAEVLPITLQNHTLYQAAIHAATPHPNCYWVLPDRLLAGDYPADIDKAVTPKKIQLLLDAGVTFFLDLTQEYERTSQGSVEPYLLHLQKIAHERNITVKYQRMPIYDGGVPSQEFMNEILDVIDTALKNGHTVYVHCLGGIGRTGSVVASHLIRHGMTNTQALEQVAYWWRSVAKSLRHKRSPQTDIQIRFVKCYSDKNQKANQLQSSLEEKNTVKDTVNQLQIAQETLQKELSKQDEQFEIQHVDGLNVIIPDYNPVLLVLQYNVDKAEREEQFEATQWKNRVPRVSKLINEVDADIVGLQEMREMKGTPSVNRFLSEFDQYRYILAFRNPSPKAFGQATLYNPAKFFPLQSFSKWFSDTPDVVSDAWSNNKDAARGSIVLCTQFMHVYQDKIVQNTSPFWIFNVHFELDEGVKTKSAHKLLTIIEEVAQGQPYIVLGDFNFFPPNYNPTAEGEKQRKILTESMKDLGKGARTLAGKEIEGTFIGYEHDRFKSDLKDIITRTDHIFGSETVEKVGLSTLYTKTMLDNEPEELTTRNYPSDHLPLVAKVRLYTTK